MRISHRAGFAFALALAAACGAEATTDDTDNAPAAPAVTPAPLSLSLTTSARGLTPRTTAKGTFVSLDGRFENAVMARRNADGTITTECHDEQEPAAAFLRGATVTSTKLEVQ